MSSIVFLDLLLSKASNGVLDSKASIVFLTTASHSYTFDRPWSLLQFARLERAGEDILVERHITGDEYQ